VRYGTQLYSFKENACFFNIAAVVLKIPVNEYWQHSENDMYKIKLE
jgi:hypothetical protein